MNNQRQFLLGIFFIIALSILAFYTLFLTDVHLFSSPHYETVYFENAYGLRDGNSVLLDGARIGKIKSVEPQLAERPEKRIKVILALDMEVELKENAKITIKESTLLGGRHVNIYAGDWGGPPLARDAEGALYGQIEKNPIAAMGDLGNLFTENRQAIQDTLSNLDIIMRGVKEGQGTVGRLLIDDDIAQDFADSVKSIKKVTGQLEGGEGLLGALLNDPELLASFRGALSNIEMITADLQAGKGIAGRLIYDDALANQLADTLETFAEMGQKLDRGEGVLGRLIQDEKMAADLDDILANFNQAGKDLQTITAQISSGEGTMGQLVMHQDLYDDVTNAVGVLTRSLEDYREAAPITAMTAVFFAAF
jgi:phospholipid/cholesterol/gamma-HCH transport system substrate-binding protein